MFLLPSSASSLHSFCLDLWLQQTTLPSFSIRPNQSNQSRKSQPKKSTTTRRKQGNKRNKGNKRDRQWPANVGRSIPLTSKSPQRSHTTLQTASKSERESARMCVCLSLTQQHTPFPRPPPHTHTLTHSLAHNLFAQRQETSPEGKRDRPLQRCWKGSRCWLAAKAAAVDSAAVEAVPGAHGPAQERARNLHCPAAAVC